MTRPSVLFSRAVWRTGAHGVLAVVTAAAMTLALAGQASAAPHAFAPTAAAAEGKRPHPAVVRTTRWHGPDPASRLPKGMRISASKPASASAAKPPARQSASRRSTARVRPMTPAVLAARRAAQRAALAHA